MTRVQTAQTQRDAGLERHPTALSRIATQHSQHNATVGAGLNPELTLMIHFTEPIVLCLSIYMAFLYGLLYLFLTAYPIVFQRIHGFEKGVSGLPYLGLIIGEFIGGFCIL
ncbi:hypothetical protein N7499_012497 [Penicillium canescens]|uniref:Uncharacterized protein n=1 Tax=Penicillium canescens TaxID=5083 RepID=A0AAD6I3L9_PENCN|nr:uncharacterized protein N7446_000858 [Penicillium canescens]KAJ6030079.1 hypothetical protein N7460_010345 [Penicillium canescens]KAJ6060456.1 hypothetical protein N7444_002310 [Penicillium canescens]KAJ6063817.1 hypothetical protein N7499_012497 [Penicillium canescens]KAJ6077922.1 hypothetical protein N7446_000858 [Penicillium canescens]KAJ6154689.1 hypothetical protein N7485_013058 [Penicillium canescens]